jgi:hypothetical protein
LNIFCGARLARTLLLGAAALAIAAVAPGRVQADPITFDPDGAAPANGDLSVGSFGFDTGNALAVKSVPLVVGQTFQLYYQSRLANVTTDGGDTVTPTGLNGAGGPSNPYFEITAVASITETVTAVNGTTASFTLSAVQAPDSFVKLYYHTGKLSDNFTGAGFEAGKVILSATPTSALPSSGNFTVSSVNGTGAPVAPSKFDTFDKPSSPPGIFYAPDKSVVGAGSSQFGANVTSFDPAFFKTAVKDMTFNSFNSTPFDATTPSKIFNSLTGPNIVANHGPLNGISGPDFQFEARASASFTPVPEPASITLVGLGLAGLVGVGRYRRNRKSN